MSPTTFVLIMRVLVGDPEAPETPAYDFVIDYGLSAGDCEDLRADLQPVWLGNESIGMFCEAEAR